MTVIALVLISGALVCLGAGGYCYSVALNEARRYFPLEFQDEKSSRYALDTMIWYPGVPANARHKYLWSLNFCSFAVGCLALFMAAQGSPLAALLFGGVFVIAAAMTIQRWVAHRDKL